MTVNGYDDLAVCNLAVSRVGRRPINSVSSPVTDIEFACATLYPVAVDTLLSRHTWKFANPVTELAADADVAPIGGYDYAYKLPSDLVAGPYAVYTAADLTRPISAYIHANDYIHTSETSCLIRYRRRPAVGIWPVYFVDLVSGDLAMRLARTPIINNADLAQALRIEVYGDARLNGEGGALKDARTADAKTQVNQSFFSNGDPLTGLVY